MIKILALILALITVAQCAIDADKVTSEYI